MVFFDVVARRPPRRPAVIPFARAKYARPILIDAGYVSAYDRFEQEGRPHVLDFFDILLITRGCGAFRIDDERHPVSAGTVFFTRPGQVRQWETSGVEGACVFFRQEFLIEAFSDPRFLEQFLFFRPDRPSAALTLPAGSRRAYLRLFGVMTRELSSLPADAAHALRAVLYELLVLLHRAYGDCHGNGHAPGSAPVEAFRASLERDFRRVHRVADYAAGLGVSPGHLNTLCRTTLRRSAGACIRDRLLLEAKRLLLYSDRTAAQVAYSLGFDDPSYFVRFFTREAGLSPIRYRRRHREQG